MAKLTSVSLNGNSSDVADAYSKSETDTLLAGKQATLTPGSGINISSNNVISATGGSSVNLYDAPLDNNGDVHTDGAITPTGLVDALYHYDYENKDLLFIEITGPAKTGGWNNIDAAIAIGAQAIVNDTGAVAIGNKAYVGESDGVAIGNLAVSDSIEGESDGVAIGSGAHTEYGGVAIGSGAGFYGDYSNRRGVAIGQNSVSRGNEVSFGNASVGFTRRLTSISDGIDATDAATKGQLDAAIAALQAQIDALRS